jgi:hypothetical protein
MSGMQVTTSPTLNWRIVSSPTFDDLLHITLRGNCDKSMGEVRFFAGGP